MKYLRMLVLPALMASALAVLLGAGSASATVLCSEYVTPCPKGKALKAGTAIELSLRGSLAIRDVGSNLIDTCTASTVKGKTTNEGSATETVEGDVTELKFEKCTSTFKTLKNGTFEIHYVGPKTTGDLISIGAEVTVSTFGVSCDYGTVGGVNLGLLESDETETPDFEEEATLPKEEGGFLCPGSIVARAEYLITAPAKIYFKEKTAA
jgi:hypothetical protein